MERDFKGVWIPKEIWLDERLGVLDKIILIEIDSLDNGDVHCYASNEYLANFCQCSETKVSTSISKLIKLGYLEVDRFDGRKRFLKSCLIKNINEDYKNCKSEYKKIKDNNIYNNKENNIDNINDTNKLVSLEQAPKTYGNQNINEMFDEWEKRFGYKPKNCAGNRRAVYNMLRAKDKGKDWLLKTMDILSEAKKDKYAGNDILRIAGFEALSYHWDIVWDWGSAKYKRNMDNNSEIDLAKI